MVHAFNVGSGAANMSSNLSYHDDEWHTVRFTRKGNNGRLLVDNTDEAKGDSVGNTRMMQIIPPLYVGGVPQEQLEDVALNLQIDKDQFEKQSFFGCIRNVQMGGKPIGEPRDISNVVPCSDQIEPGVFFEGGYVKLREKFRVGENVKIEFDIKPRSLNGFLLSVHGKKAFMILEMNNGTIRFSVS